MRAQNKEMIKQHLIATAATMDKYDLVGADKAWVQAVSAAVCADGADEFERRLDVLLEIDRLFYKKKDDFTLKTLGEALKAAAYMHMMTEHNEEAVRSFQRAMCVYSLVYANDPQSLEREKKEIANICESRALSGILPLTARI